ncbi:hypothetical protein PULV_a0388 [Pseudoalteromonas ulvae UL12]|nr:YfiR family protein [Pseudoalteromonas ulvae]MBE0362810.1 hypothetical protein [Pseudoalteromonas ulvae UL12]
MKLALFAFLILASFNCTAKTIEQVRSAFIFQMSKFIEFSKPIGDGVSFCFFDKDNGPAQLLSNHSNLISQGKPIIVHLLEKISATAELNQQCNIIYLDELSYSKVDADWLTKIDSNIVIIGEDIRFIEQGGLAALIKEGNKIKLYINKEKLNNSDLKIGSRLLALAKFYPE